MTAVPGRKIISAALGGVATGFFLAVGRIAGRDPPDPAHPESATMANMVATTQARWFHLTPGRFVIGLLAVEVLLWLSDRFGWLWWHKGYAVLTCVAVVGVGMVLMAAWFGLALVFRRRFQFSLRLLLVLVVVVALPCKWLAVEMKQAREQRETVAAMEKLGHDLLYDWQFDELGRYTSVERQPGPVWLVGHLGTDFFQTVTHVYMHQGQTPLSGVAYLKDLKDVETLMLFRANIAESDLGNLKRLNKLHVLNLRDSNVTDAGLENLKGLKQLKQLSLTGTKVTDAVLQHLKELTQLEVVSEARRAGRGLGKDG
jgi:hypothetical protein